MSRVLVAGLGNVFLGDDGFGVELAVQLQGSELPDGVEVLDVGIRGFDLALTLLQDWDAVVLLDLVARDAAPGTLFLLQPGSEEFASWRAVDGHGLDPVEVLHLVTQMGGQLPPLYVLGCQPADLGGEEGWLGLSPEVEAALPKARAMLIELLGRLIGTTAAPALPGGAPSHA